MRNFSQIFKYSPKDFIETHLEKCIWLTKCDVKFTGHVSFCAYLTSTVSIVGDNTECKKTSAVQKTEWPLQYECNTIAS